MRGKTRPQPLDFSTKFTFRKQDSISLTHSANRFFHIHLISDATGETLNRVAHAAAANYPDHQPIEHAHAMVRNARQLEAILEEIEREPGMVLYTLADVKLKSRLEEACRTLGLPCVSILDPAIEAMAGYLNAEQIPRIGGQHALNETYFSRIKALDFTMMHDDGQHPESLDQADIVLLGISRSSKTPTSIYLANRGLRTANVPFVPGHPLPDELFRLQKPLVVGLTANAAMVADIRRKRLDFLNDTGNDAYVDRREIAREITELKNLCARHRWPVIDISRRSIEETAALIINLLENKDKTAHG